MITTDRQVASLKPKDSVFWESVRSPHGGGLALRVSVKASKTWFYRYRFQGKQDAFALGRYPTMTLQQARDAHGEARAHLSDGLNPKRVFRQAKLAAEQTWTGQELFDAWIKIYSSTPSSRTKRVPSETVVIQTIWRWQKYLQHRVAPLLVNSISRQMITSLVSDVAERHSREQARKCLTIFNGMFNLAEVRGQVDHNPAFGLEPSKLGASKGQAGERYLSLDEIKLLWWAIEENDLSASVGAALRALLLTGMRRGELCQTRWNDVDLQRRLWTLPANTTKSRRAHALHISDALLDILESLPRESEFVFQSARLEDQPILPASLTTAVARLQGVKTATLDESAPLAGMERFSVHDLRRTVATGLGEHCNTPPHIIRRILNHLSEDRLEDTYQRAQLIEEQKKALNSWGVLVHEKVHQA